MIALLAAAVLMPAQEPVPLQPNRHGHRMHLLGGKLVVVGGFPHAGDREEGMRETWILDVKAGKWSAGPRLSKKMAFHGSAVVDGSIYAISGQIERLDLEGNRWTMAAPAVTAPESHFAAAALGRKIYTLGGYPQDKGAFRSFDTAAKTAQLELPMPGFKPGDHFHFLVALEGKLHAIGGLDGVEFDPVATHWVFDGKRWKAGKAPPRPLWANFSVQQVVGHRAFFIDEAGGLMYDARTDSWKELAKLPRMLVMPASYASGGFIYVLGGEMDRARGGVLKYDISKDKWLDSAP